MMVLRSRRGEVVWFRGEGSRVGVEGRRGEVGEGFNFLRG